MVAKNWNKASFNVQFSCFLTKPEEFGAINMCAFLWAKFLAVSEIHILSTTSISCVLQWSWLEQRNKTCSTVSLSVLHAHIDDSATPVLKASAFNIVSCSRIRQYATPTSRFLGQRILVLTSGINSYVCLPLLSQSHFHCHDAWAISADILYASAMDMLVGASIFSLTILIATSSLI